MVTDIQRHFQPWRTVDFRLGRLRTPEEKQHIILENCRGVVEGKVPGFVLVHESGRREVFTLEKSLTAALGHTQKKTAPALTAFAGIKIMEEMPLEAA